MKWVKASENQQDTFHHTALAAGGREKQAPPEHPEYHAGYYGAFVYDPDGNNIEAVVHDRPTPSG